MEKEILHVTSTLMSHDYVKIEGNTRKIVARKIIAEPPERQEVIEGNQRITRFGDLLFKQHVDQVKFTPGFNAGMVDGVIYWETFNPIGVLVNDTVKKKRKFLPDVRLHNIQHPIA